MPMPAERMDVELSVNGRDYTRRQVEARRTLADFLREDLSLTGTHLGCEHGACGACTVLIDDAPVRSCLTLAVQANGTRIRTVEGLGTDGELHAVQKAFKQHHALQCGFCTPGFLTASVALLEENPSPTELEVREWLSGNICRCTGYQFIVDAVLAAAAELREGRGAGTGSPA
jgi:aerobic-type carbon monoxide dehydrogenase small subunit (CoxS/CutS family)